MLVSEQDLNEIKRWFSVYVRQYLHDGPENRNIVLKEEHTCRVRDEILWLGKELGLEDDELRLAEICALLHDAGRFEQYARYHTFSDRHSENHAALGIKILKENNVLKQVDAPAKALIYRSIECHNRAALPEGEEEPSLFYIKLLRDADKLDIWRVVTEYYHRKDGRQNKAIELDLPDTPGISRKVYQDLIRMRNVQADDIRNLNDFKLLQVGWIFDINFDPTLRRIQSRRYLEMIREVLPETDEIREIFNVIQRYLIQR